MTHHPRRILGVALAVGLLAGLTLPGCYSAQMSQFGAIGADFTVTLYSGGQAMKTWHSSGKVLTEGDSDGWYFTDRATGKLVRVSGTVAIEQE